MHYSRVECHWFYGLLYSIAFGSQFAPSEKLQSKQKQPKQAEEIIKKRWRGWGEKPNVHRNYKKADLSPTAKNET